MSRDRVAEENTNHMSLHLVDSDGHLADEERIVECIGAMVPQASGGTSSKTASRVGTHEEILREVGVSYHIIGVFGGQSSGKSTLLNHLFGTNFQTLDETVRRGQTTKGAFLSKANTALEGFVSSSANVKSPVLIVDFEGTDGLERGEDQSFERQLSLFGLSMADTLIVNMWAVDVGRFNAANLSLLRTIFEVNLQLFSHDSYVKEEKPTLLIVLRDFTEADAKPSLVTVRKSFDMIWDNITRPAKFATSTIDALFNLRYYTMPHYRLQRKEFDQSVTTLRRWFGDSRSKDYLFRHRAMFRGVPLEGLPKYMSSCWGAIVSSKDLDIPTQREMLAQHGCKEVRTQELRNFVTFARQYEDRINRGEMLVRVSELLDEEVENRLKEYRRQTQLYSPEVADGYAAELERDLVDATMRVVSRLSSAIASGVLAGLDARLQSAFDECLMMLLTSAQTLPFTAGSGSDFGGGDAGMPVGMGIAGGAASARAFDAVTRFYMDNPQCQQIVLKFWKALRTELNALVDEMAVEPPPAHLYGHYVSLIAQDRTARGNVVNSVTVALFKKVTGRVSAMAESAAESIHRGFENSLSHNADGTVKFFATVKGLQTAVPPAQQAGLVLLGCLLYFRLRLSPAVAEDDMDDSTAAAGCSRSARRVVRERKRVSVRQELHEKEFFLTYTSLDAVPRYPVQVPIARANSAGDVVDEGAAELGVDAGCVLLTQPQVQRSYEIFRQKCDFTTQMQLRSIEASRQALPAWVIPALAILGFNEIKYVLTSPTLLVLLLIVGYLFFRNYIISQWQTFEETGPASIVIPLQTLIRYVQDVYEQSIQPPLEQLQRYQQHQQELVQMQHQPHPAPGGYGAHRLATEDDGPTPATRVHGAGSSNSSMRASPHDSDSNTGMRQRTVHQKAKLKPKGAGHTDPADSGAAVDTKASLPRRRMSEKDL